MEAFCFQKETFSTGTVFKEGAFIEKLFLGEPFTRERFTW
jgi:hypothetical protein